MMKGDEISLFQFIQTLYHSHVVVVVQVNSFRVAIHLATSLFAEY